MEYPELSEEGRNRMVATNIEAEKQFERDKEQRPESGLTAAQWDHYAFLQLVLTSTLAYARESLNFVRVCAPGWTIDQVEAKSRDYACRFANEVYRERGYDRFGKRLEELTCPPYGAFKPGMVRALFGSEEWANFKSYEILPVALGASKKEPGKSGQEERAVSMMEVTDPEVANLPDVVAPEALPPSSEATPGPKQSRKRPRRGAYKPVDISTKEERANRRQEGLRPQMEGFKSVNELAEAIPADAPTCTTATVYAYWNGVTVTPTQTTLAALARALGVRVDDIPK
jgi:hypothetical protein